MPPLEAKAVIRVLNCSKKSHKILNESADGRKVDWGFMFIFYKTIYHPLAATSNGLDASDESYIF